MGVTGDSCTAFVALLAVPEAEVPYNPDKITLDTTTAVRLVLDKAATVED